MGRLFGTDGIRGVVNTEITCELAVKIGRATASVLTENVKSKPRVLIGEDTRASSPMFENAIAAGLCSVGADVTVSGIVPTPAVAYLVKKYNFDAAIMISASHNSCEYNGIKIFNSDGYKLDDSVEEKIEALILDETIQPPQLTGGQIGSIYHRSDLTAAYIEHLRSTVDTDFKCMEIALDCANGSSFVTAENLFTSLGARCHVICAEPDGVNINLDCGSTHIENLSRYVKESRLSAGFAFDGDADRMLAVDENGNTVDGDKIIAICADFLKNENKLRNDTAVVTVMTNMGFYKFCDEKEIGYEVTGVGDRYVLERMLEKGCAIGGEQSGHVIFLDYATTGDGQLTALQILRIMKKTGKKLSELADCMKVYPQIMLNVKVSAMGRARYGDDEEIAAAVRRAEIELGDKGRVLVRVSGTEPLVRIMLEGEDTEKIEMFAHQIEQVIRDRLI